VSVNVFLSIPIIHRYSSLKALHNFIKFSWSLLALSPKILRIIFTCIGSSVFSSVIIKIISHGPYLLRFMTMIADHIPYTLLGNIMYKYLQCKAPSLNPCNSPSFFNFRITGILGSFQRLVL
jgi:hypothetical protein